MHIVVLPSESYIPRHSPLQGIFQADQARALARAGHEVGVVAVDADHSIAGSLRARHRPPHRLLQVADRDGLHVAETIIAPLRHGHIDYRRRYWLRAGIQSWNAYCGRWGTPKVVHAHNAQLAGSLAVRIGQRENTSIVLTEHSSTVATADLSPAEMTHLRRIYDSAGIIVVVSSALGERLRDRGLIHHYEVIPNVLAIEFERAEYIPAPSLDGPMRLLAVGNLIRSKGHADLIAAIARTLPDIDTKLTIVGDGPERHSLEHQARLAGVQARFAGEITRQSIVDELRRAHALAFPSHHETFGVAVIEALAVGRPVIATSSGGPESIIESGDGILVPPRNPAALAAGLRNLHLMLPHLDGPAIRERTLDRYGSPAVAAALHTAYLRAIHHKAGPI